MSDREMTEFLDGVVGVVEANSFEVMTLWQEQTKRGRPWKSRPSGLMEIVGRLGDMPVCVSLHIAEVDGHKLLFIDPTSQVVDHRMVDEWLNKTLPASARRPDGYLNKTDAMNFHNVLPYSETVHDR